MDYYDCEITSTDYIDLSEAEWNLPHLMQPPPRKTLSSVYGNNAPFFPSYSRNIYSCRLQRHREFHPFQHKQFSKKEIIPRRPCPYEWNFPMKNIPNHGNRYNATMLPRECSPYSIKNRFNSPYTQSSGDEFQLQNYPNELIFPKNPARMQHIMHWESEYPEMKNFGNFSVPQDQWDNSIVQSSSETWCNRKVPIGRSSLQSSKSSGGVCEEVIYSQDKEIPGNTYPQRNLDSTEPVLSSLSSDIQIASVNNSLKTVKVIEKTNPSQGNIQSTIENEMYPIENSLDLMDENALSVYFLNDFNLNSQTDDKIFDLPLNSQNDSTDDNSYNVSEEATVNFLDHENFFGQIEDLELENTSVNEERRNTNKTNLVKSLDEKSVTEIRDAKFEESTNQVHEESYGYLTDNTPVNFTGSKHNNDDLHVSIQSRKADIEYGIINDASLNEHLSVNVTTEVEDFPFKRNTDIFGLKATSTKVLDYPPKRKRSKKSYSSIPTEVIKNKTKVIKNKSSSKKRGSNWKNSDDKVNKYTAEQRFIFQAPILNINHQNQISTSFNDKKLSDGFDSKLCQGLGKDIMKLCSLQNNASVGQSNSDGKFTTPNTCLLAKNNSKLSPNEINIQMNSEVLNSSLECKESMFMYSNFLKTLPNHIETSLSSVTNYILDEPVNAGVKHCDTAFELDDIKYPPLIHGNLEDNSESWNKKLGKRERKSVKRKICCDEKSLALPLSLYTPPENTIDSSITLLDNIFQPDSVDYSSTFQETQKNNLKSAKNKQKKINWKKWKLISKRLVHLKRRSVNCLSKLHNSKIKPTKDKRKIEAFNKNSSKLYSEAFSQTTETGLNPLSNVDIFKQDAQTQWDISDTKTHHESSGHEKTGYTKTSNGKADEILCKQEEIECEKEVKFKSESNKYNWNLRPRKLESAIKSVSYSEKRTNVQTTKHNSQNTLVKTRPSRYKNLLCNKKKSSETKNRFTTPKQNGISEKQTKNHNFTNKKQSKKIQRYSRTTADNLSHVNQGKLNKFNNIRMNTDLGANQKVSSVASCAAKIDKTSKSKSNKKKK